jgi:hypothetical protein
MDWTSPIPAPPKEASLVAALWTSYRPLSSEFLAGYVLPQLMQIDRSENEEPDIREWFIAEAMEALKPLKGRLTLITSPPVSRVDSQDDAWLWHYITPFTVGKKGPCIQHAKLWLFHWKSKSNEFLQITVSSTNLMPDAFKNQIQAGWTITLPVESNGRKPKKNPLDTLVTFLSELGTSANCSERVDYWNTLIKRTTLTENIKFIASIPGKPSPLTKWPIQKTSKLWILTPFIGQWNSHSLGIWEKAICKNKAAINLLWPDKSHGWVGAIDNEEQTNWQIPEKSLDALLEQGVLLRQLPKPPVFNDGQENDKRWGHLKLYQLEDGLLIGSHNWSLSAWGLITSKGYPKNFELSVFIPGASMPCNLKTKKMKKRDICVGPSALLMPKAHWLTWAQAQWDGQSLGIEWKTTTNKSVTIAWDDGTQWHPVEAVNDNIQVAIKNPQKAPRSVKFGIADLAGNEVSIPVADIRPGDDLLPVGLPDSITEKADMILLQKYGGPPGETALSPNSPDHRKRNDGDDKEVADYRPQWLILSRRWSKVVDKWRERFEGTEDNRGSSDALRLAGALEKLSLSERNGGIGARIASEELRLLAEAKR